MATGSDNETEPYTPPPTALAPVRKMRRIKLSDQVAEELRRWIARENLGPRDRLPPEKVLMQHFGCSKSTIREALKALEVEGLLVMQSGANGGPEIQATSTDTVIQQMRQYFHFQQLDFKDVYELREKLEVMLAENVTGRLTEDHFRRLEANIEVCTHALHDDDHKTGRTVEVEFHDILAEACNNPILDLMCRFLNVMVRDLVLRRTDSLREHSAFGQQNIDAHIELLDALRREDKAAVSAVMRRHMHCAECAMKNLDATFHLDLLSRQ